MICRVNVGFVYKKRKNMFAKYKGFLYIWRISVNNINNLCTWRIYAHIMKVYVDNNEYLCT